MPARIGSNAVPADGDTVGQASLLSQRGLLRLLLSRCGSALGYQMQTVAIGWQIYALTHRALSLGLLGLAQFLPMLLLIFVAGHAADRLDRRRIAALCQLVEMGVAGLLAADSILHVLTPMRIYAMVALVGAARAFEAPAMQALLPSLVPPRLFPRAAALASSLFQTVTILGPSIGGLLYGVGAPVPYALCAAMFAAAALCVSLVHPSTRPPRRETVGLRAVFGGLGFIRERTAILGAI